MTLLRKNQHGVGAIKLLFLIPLALMGFVVLFYIYTELNKAYWDKKVRRLCEKDGGVTVYEEIELFKSNYPTLKFTSKNSLILPSEQETKGKEPFFYRFSSQVLRAGDPEIRKYEDFIVMREKKKVLGKRIIYSRVGGDFPTGISHHSSFSCRDIRSINTNLSTSIFHIQG